MSAARYSPAANLGLLLMRLMLGAVFLFHGSQKLLGTFGGPGLRGFADYLEKIQFPLPMTSAVLASLAEMAGGFTLATGVGTRLLAIPLVFVMLVAVYRVHANAFDSRQGGMEYPLTLAVMVAGIALIGPGNWTLGPLKKRRSRPAAQTPSESRAAR